MDYKIQHDSRIFSRQAKKAVNELSGNAGKLQFRDLRE